MRNAGFGSVRALVVAAGLAAGVAFGANPSVPRGSAPSAPLIGAVEDGGDPTAAWRARRDAALAADPGLPFDPTSLMIRFHPEAADDEKQLIRDLAGLEIVTSYHLVPGLEHVSVSMPVEQTLAVLAALGEVVTAIDYAEPDYFYRIGTTPNDSFYSLLWGLNNTGQTVAGNDRGTLNADIDANLAWNLVRGSSSFVVGVADSGILRTHEDLAANIWTNPGEIPGDGLDNDGNGFRDDTWGWDFWNNDNNPTDDNRHGTHVSGTIGAVGNNGRGVTGVAWTIRLAGLKIGSASGAISSSAAISALQYCVIEGIRLSNHSWGGGAFSSSLFNALSSARNAGHLVVAAAGNGGADGRGDNNDLTPQFPASYNLDNIISVAAIDNDNRLAPFSNFGPTSVDLAAPGVNIASCGNAATNSYIYLSGTSMAAPHVTGAAALVWIRNPTFTFAQVRARLLSTTKPLTSLSGRVATGGCLNVHNAVR